MFHADTPVSIFSNREDGLGDLLELSAENVLGG